MVNHNFINYIEKHTLIEKLISIFKKSKHNKRYSNYVKYNGKKYKCFSPDDLYLLYNEFLKNRNI